ncbi:PorP/SprF family type IX secretion system membrane protein [Tenacibaculum agarivorans]|uniref:PorP/SprF family type IX secretion system membrane protein n=1 Tax=Tenacibaculum agarivorans TaxID=1908389 RepID=UPI00094B9415|nr:type IX secretion system membrane protein PorP/SprF [Tenacibaculum agarivorans]
MFNLLKKETIFLYLFCCIAYAQETLPIYQDYLSDNVYLLHPAAAGVGNCGKIRLTARTQWLGTDNAPELQTLSFHSRFNEYSNAAYGIILFNDKNGFHSQKAIQGTYAYHIKLSNGSTFKQLSFGLSLSIVLNDVDQRTFSGDPQVQQIIESDLYTNADFSVGYHHKGLSSYLTVKNIFLSAQNNLRPEFETLDLRNYIIGAGYFFGNKEKLQFEPSFMFQLKERTFEKVLDLNMKVYKNFKKSQIWLAASYRSSFGGSAFGDAQYISPIAGINFNRFMFSYTYTKQSGEILFSDTGFHQITLGLDLLCKRSGLEACPNISGRLF